MAKGEGWRRSSLARLVSRSLSFPSSYDRTQRSCSGEMRPDKPERHQDGAGYHQPMRILHRREHGLFVASPISKSPLVSGYIITKLSTTEATDFLCVSPAILSVPRVHAIRG